ncbi:rhomboid family protein [Tenacibaculum adriaticum]|uniref:Rhomboid family protein n=1 Tax=Tenacibaculum adriaticum TaxID=413713 RepID=A0A5S5DNW6_9FLAO|nr:rhomboid family intramembrane serine protease [Tenacibaculum adriaticum]TYP96726.1 rhomboid family protein [Tenacibaculum adriaticum]
MNQIVLIIIIANVLVSIKGFSDAAFFDKYKFQIGNIKAGEKLRMVTSGFLHVDWLHLGFNMYALYLFGKIVASSFGNVSFLLIYFGSLLIGSLYSFSQHKNETYYSAVGASGAVSGIVFSAIILYPDMELIMLPIPIPIPGYIFGIGYLLYSIYGMKNRVGNIGHSAHLGGAIGGYLLTLLMRPSVVSNNTTMILIMGGIIAGLLFFGDKLQLKK